MCYCRSKIFQINESLFVILKKITLEIFYIFINLKTNDLTFFGGKFLPTHENLE